MNIQQCHIRCITILILFLLSNKIVSQEDWIVERLTSADGLSSSSISALTQDSSGFIWLGTGTGLNKYDGLQFNAFKKNTKDEFSISDNAITQIKDKGDYLLVGTGKGGLNLFHKPTQKFYTLRDETNEEILSESVKYIHEDKIGQFWVAYGESWKLFRLSFPVHFFNALPSHQLLESIEIKQISINQMTTIIESNEHSIFGLSNNGDYLEVDIRSGLIQPANKPSFVINPTKGFDYSNSNRLFHTTNTIYFAENEQPKKVQTDFEVLWANYYEEDKQLWISSPRKLILFQDWEPKEKVLNLSDGIIVQATKVSSFSNMMKDETGVVWAASNSGFGICRIPPRQFHIKTYNKGSQVYAPIYADGDDIVFDDQDKGIIHYGSANPPFEVDHPVLNDLVNRIWHPYTEESLLVTGESIKRQQLVICLDEKGKGFKELFAIPASLDPKRKLRYTATYDKESGEFWIAFSSILTKYNPVTNDIKRYSFEHISDRPLGCYALLKTKNNHWWISSWHGLVHAFIPLGNQSDDFQFEMVPIPEGDIDQSGRISITSLSKDPYDEQVIWLGSYGDGLHRLDIADMTFKHFNMTTGLPNGVIYGILEDDEKNLWMSSNKAIIQLHPKTFEIRNFTPIDGMQSNEFNSRTFAKASDGRLLFGGIKGLNVFHPADLQLDTVVPQVQIIDLMVNHQSVDHTKDTKILDQSIEYTKEITLPYTHNNITLKFRALDFSSPKRNRYSFYLEGAEEPWQHESNANEARYLNLAPGDHTFKVKATNGDGIWNEKPKELRITIRSPWYRTYLAYGLYVLFSTLIILGLIKMRDNRFLMKLQMEEDHKEAERLKELDVFKSKLYTNITHEFRTPLTVILGMSEQLESDLNTMSPQETQQKISFIRRNGRNLLSLVNQMLDLSKVENNQLKIHYKNGNIIQYIRYITESFHSYANVRNVRLKMESQHQTLLMDYDAEKIQQIMSNLLSNAIKHSPSGGKVMVIVSNQPASEIENHSNTPSTNYLSLKIKDTGAGISTKDLPNIFNRFYQGDDKIAKSGGTGIGLALTKELVQLLEGQIEVESELGIGSTFSVLLPILQNVTIEEVEGNMSSQKMHTEPIPSVAPISQRSLNGHGFKKSNKEDRPNLLIIEDNPDVVEYLASCLEKQYVLDFAYNGQIGIEKALENIPDLIISDVMMPEKDGFEVCEQLKNDERSSHIPIVLLTAKADVESRITGLSRGADAYLKKPFYQKELLVILQNLLELRKKLQARYANLITENASEKKEKIELKDLTIEDAFLKKIQDLVEKDLSNAEFSVHHLSRGMGMSRSQIYKKIKALTGRSTSQFVRSIRLYKAQNLLKNSEMNVSEVAYEVGFSSPVYFSNVFFEEFGVRPKEIGS